MSKKTKVVIRGDAVDGYYIDDEPHSVQWEEEYLDGTNVVELNPRTLQWVKEAQRKAAQLHKLLSNLKSNTRWK